MKIYSLLFLHPLERSRELKTNEEFSAVTEGTATISTDYYREDIPVRKEEFIYSVMESCSEEADKQRVKYIMELALGKSFIDADIYRAILTHSNLPAATTKELFTSLSKAVQQRYKSDFIPNEQHVKDIDKTLILCDKIEDVKSLIESSDSKGYHKLIRTELQVIKTMMSSFINSYYKHLVELQYQCLYKCCVTHGESWMLDLIHQMVDTNCTNTMTFDQAVSSIRVGTQYNEYLEQKKKETNNEINIIMMDEENITSIKPSLNNRNFTIVPTAMNILRGGVIPYDKVNMLIGKTTTLQLSPVDIFKYCSSKDGKVIERVTTTCGRREVCIGYDNLNLGIVSVEVTTGDILYVPLVGNLDMTPNMEFLLGNNDMYTKEDCTIVRIKYRDKKGHDLDVLTEGIKFTEDGGIKLTYKPRTTYMDDYSRMNKIIVQNARNHNTEGVKSDLVFLFSFIHELEKITKGKVKVKDSTKEDAMKARMFATGDFKQYLAFVQERDPSFNFSKYFEDNYKNEDKVMIEFSNAEIKGIRLLLKTILG